MKAMSQGPPEISDYGFQGSGSVGSRVKALGLPRVERLGAMPQGSGCKV